jgi:hypothetical protein
MAESESLGIYQTMIPGLYVHGLSISALISLPTENRQSFQPYAKYTGRREKD